jgi:hypothetical protein
VTDFSATESVGGLTSTYSPDLLATVDLTPPTVTLSTQTPTTTLAPVIHVEVTDANGILNGMTYTLDLGSHLDYASGTLTDGQATAVLPALSGAGTYTLVGHALDRAGNLGTSTTLTLVVTDSTPWVVTGQALQPDPSGDVLNEFGDVQVWQPLNPTCGGPMGFG